MNEELVREDESLRPTRLDRISVIRNAPFDNRAFRRSVARVIDAAKRNDRQDACATLAAMELGYAPGETLCKDPQQADCDTCVYQSMPPDGSESTEMRPSIASEQLS